MSRPAYQYANRRHEDEARATTRSWGRPLRPAERRRKRQRNRAGRRYEERLAYADQLEIASVERIAFEAYLAYLCYAQELYLVGQHRDLRNRYRFRRLTIMDRGTNGTRTL
jgi:hypothetical protein